MPEMNQLTEREVHFVLHCWWFELVVGCFCCFGACGEAMQGQQDSSHGGQRAGMKRRRQMAQIPFKNTLWVT